MTGFVILTGYGIVLFLIDGYIRKRRPADTGSISSLIFAGGKVKDSTLIFSVLAAWMWTTSIFGASETYLLYGIWGPLGYVIGACIAFGALVGFLCLMKKRMPGSITYLDLIQKRYGKRTKLFFYIFAFVISAYVLVEQAVGIAYVMETFFGSSFKLVAFFSVILAMVFVLIGGMKNLLASEGITSLVILAGFVILAAAFAKKGPDPENPLLLIEGKGWLTSSVLIPAFRYFIMAIVIAFSQLAFDPAYYLKAHMAESLRQMKKTYLVGGILLWGSISLISSIYLGWVSAGRHVEVTALFGGWMKVLFAIVIVFIGISTVSHYLMGMLGTFSVDFYQSYLRRDADQREKIVFGRVMTVAIGVFCALIAISLEDISLLTIDVFCAIFFAAPCGPLLMACFSRKDLGKLPIVSTSLGIVCGLIFWMFATSHTEWGQFLGMTLSLGVPLLIMMFFGYCFVPKESR